MLKYFGIFLFCLILLQPDQLSAQFEPAPVSRSEVVETFNGKRYYMHTISQGQTLFSIARAYEVTPQVIADANPEIPDLLQVVRTGQVIRIPKVESAAVTTEPQPAEQLQTQVPIEQPGQIMRTPVITTEFIEHVVARRETLFGISRKYGISQEEIIHYNPEVRSGLRFRQVLQIPQKKATPVEFFYYQVKPGETVYGLINRFEISEAELFSLNPELEEHGLKADQRIRIPAKVAVAISPDLQQPESLILIPAPVKPDETAAIDAYCLSPRLKPSYNVALLIPLFLDQFAGHSPGLSVNHVSFTFIQYYQGVLIALDSIKQKGVDINLHVFDVGRDLTAARDLTHQPDFDKMDLIIGPFYPETLGFIAGFGLRNNIPVVSPLLDDSKQLKNFPNLFQVTTSMQTQLSQLAGYIARFYPDENIILVHNHQPQARDIINAFRQSLTEELDYAHRFGDSLNLARVDGYFQKGTLVGARKTNVLLMEDSLFAVQNDSVAPISQTKNEYTEIIFETAGVSGLVNSFDQNRKNIVITLIGGEAFLSNYLRELDQLSDQYEMVLFGTPQWADYQLIDPRYYETLNIHIFSTDFIDYRDRHIKNFVYRYRELFKTEPANDAFKGAQTAYYFFYALGKYGKEFSRCMNLMNGPVDTNPFFFEKLQSSNDGWENLRFTLYRQKDFRRENVLRPTFAE